MGVVYEAEDTASDPPGLRVALKVLTGTRSTNPLAVQRFLREARYASQFVHPNVVAVLDVGDETGTRYLAMELVRGLNAGDTIRKSGAMPWQEATRIVGDVARALSAAHATGLVHRDLKPANVIIGDDGVVKLTDFGLSKLLTATEKPLTAFGQVVGTPHYMSPEQTRADPLDARSDIYSLGATYFALLTGHAPYARFNNPTQVMTAHNNLPVPDPREERPDIPEVVVEILRRAMAKKPEERFATAEQMAAALERTLSGGALTAELPDPLIAEAAKADAPALRWLTFAAWGLLAAGVAAFVTALVRRC
jgi:urea transport system substrate-binding protein